MPTISENTLQFLLSRALCKLDSVTFCLLVALWALLLAVAVSYVHICMYVLYVHTIVHMYICTKVRITAKLLPFSHSLALPLCWWLSRSSCCARSLSRTLCEHYRKLATGENQFEIYQIKCNFLNCSITYANTIIKKTLPLLGNNIIKISTILIV